MSTSNLYRGLFELLTLPHGDAAAEMLLTSGRVARRELLVIARQEGCLPELYARWAAQSLLSPTEINELEQITRRRAGVGDVLRALPSGSLLAAPQGARSSAAAIEVLLPDFAAIGPLHEALGRLEYRLGDAGQWRLPPRGPLHQGLASFDYEPSLGEGPAVRVQVGGAPIDARRHVAFGDLAADAARLEGLACRGLAPTRQVLHRLASFGARATPVTLREIADLHQLLKDPAQRVDTTWLQVRIEQLDAWAGLRQLRDAIVARRLGALLGWGAFGRLVDASAAHAESTATRRAGAPRVASFVRSAFELVRSPRANDVAARLARVPWLVSQVLDAGYRVCGVPVSAKAFDAPRLMRIDGALYVATGAGVFLLSLVDLADPARAELGERVRTASRPVVLARWTAARAVRRSARS
ncbi:MAG: hypothetical protein JF586_07885 [Burkholderiales bacterium]|nr:hypothetical protein [Burkholderiales bacterium]